MSPALTYSGALTILVCWCGIRHGVPSELRSEQERTGLTVYCPLGHGHVPADQSENAKLKQDIAWYKDRKAAAEARADQIEASLRTTKGHVTRLRRRVLEGECPLCGQHLRDLARHVARVHLNEPIETSDPA